MNAEQGEHNAVGRQREGDRVAKQHEYHQARKHQRRDVVDEKGGHGAVITDSWQVRCRHRCRRLGQRIRQCTAQDGDALDEFRHSLER